MYIDVYNRIYIYTRINCTDQGSLVWSLLICHTTWYYHIAKSSIILLPGSTRDQRKIIEPHPRSCSVKTAAMGWPLKMWAFCFTHLLRNSVIRPLGSDPLGTFNSSTLKITRLVETNLPTPMKGVVMWIYWRATSSLRLFRWVATNWTERHPFTLYSLHEQKGLLVASRDFHLYYLSSILEQDCYTMLQHTTSRW